MKTYTIGLDTAKSVFQVHRITNADGAVEQRRLRRHQVETYFRRLPPSVVGIEACGAAHHWARLLTALGHEVRMMPPQYVKPYVKRNKTDARDAEAICEAATRPTMRFVPIKTEAQQAGRGLQRARELLVGQRSQLMHSMRGLAGELGIVTGKGDAGAASLRKAIATGTIAVPDVLREALAALARQWEALATEIAALDRRIEAQARADETARRLMAVPGIGPQTAHALACGIVEPERFPNARSFAAYVGLTPKQNSSGDTSRSGRISKAGDEGLRRLLVLAAASLVAARRRAARTGKGNPSPWLDALLARRKPKVAMIAMAARLARIVWAMLTKNTAYRASPLAA